MKYAILRDKRRRLQLAMAAVFIVVVAGGWRFPLLGFFVPACMLLGMGIATIRGRKWCDSFCPRGSFYDVLPVPSDRARRIPAFFKATSTRIAVMALLMGMMVFQLIRGWPDPGRMGMVFVVMLSATTLIGILLAFAAHKRTWCCVCPIGSLGNWIGGRKHPLLIDSSRCTECGMCRKVCPIDINPQSFRKAGIQVVADRDCLKCGLCVAVCPVKALAFGEPA